MSAKALAREDPAKMRLDRNQTLTDPVLIGMNVLNSGICQYFFSHARPAIPAIVSKELLSALRRAEAV